MKLKILFLGLGSIGKRHFFNLTHILDEMHIPYEIDAVRHTTAILADDLNKRISNSFSDIQSASGIYDMAFICNPTDMHYNTLRHISDKAKAIFIEKPVFDSVDYDFLNMPFLPNAKIYVAAPLRYCKTIRKMYDIAQNERIYSVRAICSSYLPEWRPDADYRSVYSAHKDRGGGVKIDLIHEWDYLTYMFAFPEKISLFWGKYSHLEIDSEDLACYLAQYNDKIIELHLDYFGRKPQRMLQFFTENDVITADIINTKISYANSGIQTVFNENSDEKYIAEMKYFIELAIGAHNISDNPISNAMRVMKLTEGILS